MTTVEILKAARELISDPARWTTGTMARNADGKPTSGRNDNSVCWCALGAIIAQYGGKAEPYTLLEDAARELFPLAVGASYVNDHIGHEASLAMFDRAITLAEQEAPTC